MDKVFYPFKPIYYRDVPHLSYKQRERRDKFFRRGKILFEKGQYVKARLEFKNAIQIDPKFAKGYYMVGLCAYQLKNWSEAFANFRRAIELDPHLYDAQIKIGQ
ncbi:MAG: tetratricopeptide repeat protein, partial [Deltaproteobacteria bacterium]|nr:tetratricopeptide repeat protein [Deltaproteobacteria bacterium]